MLTRDNFTKEHIRELQNSRKKDPALIERTIYAFGLLEAIARVGMPFIFKGGTCLILLFQHPQRLSTDIDIIVEPETDVENYIEKASKIVPFVRYEEQVRKGKNSIEKQHFKFTFGDKLTAFAPHTIGIPLRVGKDMEVMKQLYDLSTLIDGFKNFDEVKKTYQKVAQSEIAYRGIDVS